MRQQPAGLLAVLEDLYITVLVPCVSAEPRPVDHAIVLHRTVYALSLHYVDDKDGVCSVQ